MSGQKILKGRAEISIRLRTLGDVMESEGIERRLQAVGSADEAQRKGTLSYLIASTEALEIKDDPHPVIQAALKSWKHLVDNHKEMDAAQLWSAWCALPEAIISAWILAYSEAQTIWERDPAWLPTEALKPDEKVEAAKPDSPLAVAAKK